MANCRYCREPAGTLALWHGECRERYQIARKRIPEFFVKALDTSVDPKRFRELAHGIAEQSFIDEKELRKLVIAGLTDMIEHALEDDSLSGHEGERINALREAFEIQGTDADFNVVAHKLKKAEIIRDLSEGREPQGVGITGVLPVNLGKNERVVWIMNGVDCLKLQTRTSYIGGSHGASFRLMKGVTYRVGSYKGRTIRTKEYASAGRGSLILTTKHVFFWSSRNTFRIQPKKIISIEPYSDGISILGDGANATPIIFKLDDPWFAANVIAKLNQVS